MTVQLTKLSARLVINWLFENVLDQENAKYPRTIDFDDFLTDGTGVDQGQVVWYDQRTVNASATDSLDLASALVSAFGTAITFTKVKMIYIENTSTTAADILRLTRPAAGIPLLGASGDYMNIGPGGIFFWWLPSAAGVAVTATTADLLDIVEAGGANNVTYRIAIAGIGTVA